MKLLGLLSLTFFLMISCEREHKEMVYDKKVIVPEEEPKKVEQTKKKVEETISMLVKSLG